LRFSFLYEGGGVKEPRKENSNRKEIIFNKLTPRDLLILVRDLELGEGEGGEDEREKKRGGTSG